jgi:hypothetical protein
LQTAKENVSFEDKVSTNAESTKGNEIKEADIIEEEGDRI